MDESTYQLSKYMLEMSSRIFTQSIDMVNRLRPQERDDIQHRTSETLRGYCRSRGPPSVPSQKLLRGTVWICQKERQVRLGSDQEHQSTLNPRLQRPDELNRSPIGHKMTDRIQRIIPVHVCQFQVEPNQSWHDCVQVANECYSSFSI